MSTTKNPTHKKVLESARKAKPLQPQSEIPGYMRKLSQIPDRALASELALEQAGLEFDVKDGKDIPRYELDCKENETAFTASKFSPF